MRALSLLYSRNSYAAASTVNDMLAAQIKVLHAFSQVCPPSRIALTWTDRQPAENVHAGAMGSRETKARGNSISR